MMRYLLLAHLAGVIVWIGGMFFAHFCLRPVATLQLPPPQRLPLMTAVLGRFFAAVAVSVIAILGSGFAMIAISGFAGGTMGRHLMMGIGVAMTLIFAVIYLRLYPQLRARIAADDWLAGGAVLDRIRRLVVINLGLGTLTVLVAMVPL